MRLSPSPSSLCSLQDRPVNPRDEVLRQGRDFNQGASRPRRWQASASKQPSHWGLNARFFCRSERKSNEELKSKGNREGEAVGLSSARVFSLVRRLRGKGQPSEGGCSSLPFTGREGQATSPRAEQRSFSLQSDRGAGSSRQAIGYDYNNKSKSKKQFPTWTQNGFPPSNKICHKAEDNTMDIL